MGHNCTRREFLVRLSAAHAAMALGCNQSSEGDWLGRERVCIHVFDLREPLPGPLQETDTAVPPRGNKAYFNPGIPELALCTTSMKFLQMFQYFWPVTREEMARLERTTELRFQRAIINSGREIEEFAAYLRAHRGDSRPPGTSIAALFTFHDYTRQWIAAVVRASQQAGVDEFVLFKDPTLPPYLCDYPSRQKGFRRPPR